ncbi:uncharacterized protein LOC143460759 [Clavelina lepadiformis]|uniref:uncharacterized protein LOC143460759 n=1 Tax=Clavelina lepadiformis TaxID=159417 RepID=UPI0040417A3F
MTNNSKLTCWSKNGKYAQQFSLIYPWEKLTNLGYDSWWIDAGIHPSSDILRTPSLTKHPSFTENGDEIALHSIASSSKKEKHKNVESSASNSSTWLKWPFSDEHKDRSCLPTISSKKSKDSIQCHDTVDGKSPNKSKSEIEIQNDYLEEKYGLYRFQIIQDGNCLYRALAQALIHDQSKHLIVRKEVVQFISENRKDFENIVEGDFDIFLNEAIQDGVWASYIEILALTWLLDINVIIVTGGFSSDPKVHITCHHFDPHNEKLMPKDTVWLSWLSSGHYDVILKKKMKNRIFDEWAAAKKNRMKSDEELAKQLAQDEKEYWDNGSRPEDKANGPCVKCEKQNPVNKQDDVETMLAQDEEYARILQEEEDMAYVDELNYDQYV